MIKIHDFRNKNCVPCEGGVPPLSSDDAREYLTSLSGWELDSESKKISKKFSFKDFVQAMVFVNMVAVIAEAEGHHPDIAVSYNKVTCELTTHAIGGLSENDFIVAAKIDAIGQ